MHVPSETCMPVNIFLSHCPILEQNILLDSRPVDIQIDLRPPNSELEAKSICTCQSPNSVENHHHHTPLFGNKWLEPKYDLLEILYT